MKESAFKGMRDEEMESQVLVAATFAFVKTFGRAPRPEDPFLYCHHDTSTPRQPCAECVQTLRRIAMERGRRVGLPDDMMIKALSCYGLNADGTSETWGEHVAGISAEEIDGK